MSGPQAKWLPFIDQLTAQRIQVRVPINREPVSRVRDGLDNAARCRGLKVGVYLDGDAFVVRLKPEIAQ